MQRIRAKSDNQRFWIEVPPDVEWILTVAESPMLQAGKLNDGSLLVVDRYSGAYLDGIGWVIRLYKNFRMVVDKGNYPNPFLRALARKLGVKQLPWEHGILPSKHIWVSADSYLSDEPMTSAALKQHQEGNAIQLEEAGQIAEAAEYRKHVGLPVPKRLAAAK